MGDAVTEGLWQPHHEARWVLLEMNFSRESSTSDNSVSNQKHLWASIGNSGDSHHNSAMIF